MAHGKKTGGRDFTKGSVPNPIGAAAHNKDVKRLRKLSQEEISQVGSLILEGNLDALKAIKDDQNASVLKVWFASVAVKAISKGDAQSMNVLLDRIVGKVKDRVGIGLDLPDEVLAEVIRKRLEENGSEN